MNWIFAGLIIFFAAYAVNQFVMTEATKKLDDSMKLKLFEVFSKRNNYATLFLLAIVLLFLGALQFMPQHIFLIIIIYVIVYAAYLIFRFASNYKKLKQLEVPPEYMKRFLISYGVFALGFLSLALCVVQSWFY
jgi:Ca2+/Na+ antiporter